VQVVVKGRKTVTISSDVTIIGGYHAVGKFLEKNSALACAGTTTASISDTIDVSLTLDDFGAFTVTDIKNPRRCTPSRRSRRLRGRVGVVPPEIFTSPAARWRSAARRIW